MEQKRLNQINGITNDFHDDVASINEEFVDGNKNIVLKYCDNLIQKIRDFKSNIKKDAI
ncbi:MAG: hypothetical protein KAS32_01345 [Candidatus Peribacteraceae bacterium]|nr:hypothetical protein [Candidatus Peribacteraceae bacterium]